MALDRSASLSASLYADRPPTMARLVTHCNPFNDSHIDFVAAVLQEFGILEL